MSVFASGTNPPSIFLNASLHSFTLETRRIPGACMNHGYPKTSAGLPRKIASHAAVPVMVATALDDLVSSNVFVLEGTRRTFGSSAMLRKKPRYRYGVNSLP